MKPPRQFAQMPHVSCASGASSSAATCFMKQSVESSHADDVLQQVGRRLRGRDEMGEDFFVLFPMQEKRVCRLTVASRSADLLVVGDEVLRKLEMNDETDVRLVIPHAQLHGGGKHPGITGHAACDEERHRHQEQVKRRGWQAQARNAAGDGRG